MMQLSRSSVGALSPGPLSPCYVVLPGREEWIYLCHAFPASCPDCRRTIARAFAVELGFNVRAALDLSGEDFIAALSPDLCSGEQAAELRRLTVAACYPGVNRMSLRPEKEALELHPELGELVVADFITRAPARESAGV